MGQYARAFGKFDVRDDERVVAGVLALTAAVDRVGVDGAGAGKPFPGEVLGRAVWAAGPWVPDQGAAVGAARGRQCVVGEARLKVGEYRVGHQSSAPSSRVAAAVRKPRLPPWPWTSPTRQSGTWTSSAASPRSWRTASMVRIMPPRESGWLLHRPPPSVLNGSAPSARSVPPVTNAPPLPFSQKPRSSKEMSTVM